MLSEKPRSELSETRKMTKSTMEKRRRQRINNSLTELKSILSGMITHKGERFDKMEKADILEMTVKCVRQLQKQANSADGPPSPSNVSDEDYKSGMHKCMSEVIKFISSSNFSDADPAVKTKLLDHLANKLSDTTVKVTSDIPYQRHSLSPRTNNLCCPKLADDFSDTDNDANNNVNSVSPPLHQETPGTISPMFSSGKTALPESDQQLQQVSQTNLPTVPLTILVPANLCSTPIGTTCVIPLNIPGINQQQINQSNFIPSIATSGLTTYNSLTLPSASGISLLSNQNTLMATTPASSTVTNTIPENNKTITFSPTVITDNTNIEQNTMPNIYSNPSTMSSSTTATAPSRSPIALQLNVAESTFTDSSNLSNLSTSSNHVIKQSSSPQEPVSQYNTEHCGSYSDRNFKMDQSYGSLYSNTSRQSSIGGYSQYERAETRVSSSERSYQENYVPHQNHHTAFRNIGNPMSSNNQSTQSAKSHWRPW
ncbi:Transcription factor [Mactra antiquata]